MGCRVLFSIFVLLTASFALPAKKNLPKGIDWFKGSVEGAFKVAEKQRKPLFLYWGAVWCPPCNRIKKNIFTKPLFQEKMKEFVAVYLDGDTSRADKWGEKLNAETYPTLLILNPQGKELIRLPVQGTVDEYIKLMDSVVSENRTIAELLELVKKQPIHKIPSKTWSLLARHSWFQDNTLGSGRGEKTDIFKMLYQKVPPRYNREQKTFFLNYLLSLPEPDKGKSLADQDQWIDRFEKLLAEVPFEMKLFDDILHWGGYLIIEKIYAKKPAKRKEKAQQRLLKIAITRRAQKGIATEEKLHSFYPAAQIYKEKLPDHIKKQLVGLIESIDKEMTNVQERYGLMATGIILLKEAKMYLEAKKWALKESKGEMAPYYFMAKLASIEQNMGNEGMALRWKQQAWEAAPKGSFTRFVYGFRHLSTLLKLVPDNIGRISPLALKILEEVLLGQRAFGEKNQRIFKMFGKALKKWVEKEGIDKVVKKKRKKALKKIGMGLKKTCGQNANKKYCLEKLKEYKLIGLTL